LWTTSHQNQASKREARKHQSVRPLGEASGISKTAAQRQLSLFRRAATIARSPFKLSTVSMFVEKVGEVVGLLPESAAERVRAGAWIRRTDHFRPTHSSVL
jgi:hypothetical protein